MSGPGGASSGILVWRTAAGRPLPTVPRTSSLRRKGRAPRLTQQPPLRGKGGEAAQQKLRAIPRGSESREMPDRASHTRHPIGKNDSASRSPSGDHDTAKGQPQPGGFGLNRAASFAWPAPPLRSQMCILDFGAQPRSFRPSGEYDRDSITDADALTVNGSPRGRGLAATSPSNSSSRQTAISFAPPTTRRVESGSHAIGPSSPISMWRRPTTAWVSASNRVTIPSRAAMARYRPSGLNASDRRSVSGTCRSSISAPDGMSSTETAGESATEPLVSRATARRRPSGRKATASGASRNRISRGASPSRFHRYAIGRWVIRTRRRPQGDRASDKAHSGRKVNFRHSWRSLSSRSHVWNPLPTPLCRSRALRPELQQGANTSRRVGWTARSGRELVARPCPCRSSRLGWPPLIGQSHTPE